MKRINTGLLILCICFAMSCTKTTPTNAGSWTFQGDKYTAGVASRTDTPGIALVAVSSDENISVFFYFNTYPTASGTYTVVNSITPAPGQVGIQLGEGEGSSYLYVPSGSTSPQASVTVRGGKASITVPPVMLVVYRYSGYYTTADSALFTASISQTQ